MSLVSYYHIRDSAIRTIALPISEKDIAEYNDINNQYHILNVGVNYGKKKEMIERANAVGIETKGLSNKRKDYIRQYIERMVPSIEHRVAIFMREHYNDERFNSHQLQRWYYNYLRRNDVAVAINYYTNRLLIKDDVIAAGGIW